MEDASPASQNASLEAATAEENSQLEVKTKWADLMGVAGRPVLHKKTSVLIFYWHPDYCDVDVSEEVSKLRKVFEQHYRFKVVTKSLDTKTVAQIQAFRHLSAFVGDEDDENGLLIVYYVGHGGTEATSLGNITLSGRLACNTRERRFYTIEWPDVERVLEFTKSDVLEIFDCCHAGLLCSPARSDTRCFEFIGACNANQRTPTSSKHSFTTAITWALEQLATKPGFFSHELLKKIQSAPDFSKSQSPQFYPGRYDTHTEYLYIAPNPHEGQEATGLFRDERDEQVEQEELLDLRFLFDRPITHEDLEALAKELKAAMKQRKIHSRQVSLLGKYNIKTYNINKRNLMRRTAFAWKQRTLRSKSQIYGSTSSPTKAASTTESIPKESQDSIGLNIPGATIHSSPVTTQLAPCYPQSPEITDEEHFGDTSSDERCAQ